MVGRKCSFFCLSDVLLNASPNDFAPETLEHGNGVAVTLEWGDGTGLWYSWVIVGLTVMGGRSTRV